jgi:hypothetical protein
VFVFDGQSDLDVITDFSRAEGDRFDLGGRRFTGLMIADANGDGLADSRLQHATGEVIVLGVSDLDLGGWNGLVV